MPRRSKEEINTEVELLKSMTGRLRDNCFGDSNNDALEAQISVLTGTLEEDEIYEREENGEMKEHTASSARDAVEWVGGNSEIESLAAEWEPLIVR